MSASFKTSETKTFIGPDKISLRNIFKLAHKLSGKISFEFLVKLTGVWTTGPWFT